MTRRSRRRSTEQGAATILGLALLGLLLCFTFMAAVAVSAIGHHRRAQAAADLAALAGAGALQHGGDSCAEAARVAAANGARLQSCQPDGFDVVVSVEVPGPPPFTSTTLRARARAGPPP